MSKDILIEQGSDGLWDIDFDTDGDFLLTEGLETAIFMSILCERRADESEITKPEFRRGDWSNELNDIEDYEVGSKLWLLDQARTNEETMNVGIGALEECLDWMKEDNLIKDYEIPGTISGNSITYTIELTKQNNEVETFRYSGFEITYLNN